MECRKTLSLLLVLLLLFACIPVTALAAETDALIEEIEESESAEEVIQENEEEDTIDLVEEAIEEESEETGDEHEDCPEADEDEECEDNFYPTAPSVDDILMELYPDGIPDGMLNLDEVLGNKTRKSDGMMLMSGGSSGSETGNIGGGGSAASTGSSNMVAAGVTMQVVYYRYDESYNRFNSHANVVNTLHSGMAIPWNSSGRDIGERSTTVFDNFTISSNTFIVKAMMYSYPYVYRFEPSYVNPDGCTFTWPGFADFWFSYYNPGGRPETSPHIVHNQPNGSYEIEEFITRIILGNGYGAWDKLNVARGETVYSDYSLFASTLRYLGASDRAIQNYLDAYFGKLSVSQDGDTLIPTIIWAWVGAENLGGANRIYSIGDVAMYGSSNPNWLNSAYTSPSGCISGYGNCSWMRSSTDTMICKMMLGGGHTNRHYTGIWQNSGSGELFGTGLVNRIQTQVDSTEENGVNTFYYLRGYWTPYGSGDGSVTVTKTNVSGTTALSGAEFVLYRDAACTVPITGSDYASLSSSDTGYVNVSTRRTNGSGNAVWTGLHNGTYFMVEAKAPDGYKVNVDTWGNVEVKEIAVKPGANVFRITNEEAAKPTGRIQITKRLSDTVSGTKVAESNATFSITDSSGTVVGTITTNARGIGESEELLFGTYTVRQTAGLRGASFCSSWTVSIGEKDRVYSYTKDNPLWTSAVAVIKKETGTGVPLVATFELCERAANGTVTVLETGTTDRNGKLTFSRKISYRDGVCNASSYFVREKTAPDGYVLDTREHTVACTANGQTVNVTVENDPIRGKIEIHKFSSLGTPMRGVEFTLEASPDGTTWQAVTDANGLARFNNLPLYSPSGEQVIYHVTETKTLNGATLMPEAIWEGTIGTDADQNRTVTLRVVNSEGFELPRTGSSIGMELTLGAILLTISGIILLVRRKRVL